MVNKHIFVSCQILHSTTYDSNVGAQSIIVFDFGISILKIILFGHHMQKLYGGKVAFEGNLKSIPILDVDGVYILIMNMFLYLARFLGVSFGCTFVYTNTLTIFSRLMQFNVEGAKPVNLSVEFISWNDHIPCVL